MADLRGRISDWLRERRIRRFVRLLVSVEESDRPAAWAALRDEIKRRSSRQIERMERDRGLV